MFRMIWCAYFSYHGASSLVRSRSSSRLVLLPEHTRYSAERVLEQLDFVEKQIALLEKRMKELFAPNKEIQLLMTLPGVGFILAVVVLSEVGEI
jgi:transposase